MSYKLQAVLVLRLSVVSYSFLLSVFKRDTRNVHPLCPLLIDIS